MLDGATMTDPDTGTDAGAPTGPFHLYETNIESIRHALATKELTCDRLVRDYFKRIKNYSGHCVKYQKTGDGTTPDYDFYMPSGKGVYLGVVEPIANAGKVNAIQSLNLRPGSYTALGFAPPHDPGPRSETDLIDADPSLPDALEVAASLDQEFAQTGVLARSTVSLWSSKIRWRPSICARPMGR